MTKITIFNRLIVKFLKVRKTQGAENGIILGDFNASGAYVKTKDWQTNRLRGSEFEWLLHAVIFISRSLVTLYGFQEGRLVNQEGL